MTEGATEWSIIGLENEENVFWWNIVIKKERMMKL